MKYDYSVIVVGGGHAGLEAAFACSKLGEKTLLVTLNIKKMADMPCNPSIGGSAKGVVVREIDALGGMMGMVADQEYIQMKMLNTGKGPGVQCLRAQMDKLTYPAHMQKLALKQEKLTVLEGMVIDLLHDEEKVFGVRLEDGKEITAQAVILTTGTFMEAIILRGHKRVSSGPDGEKPSIGLSDALKKMGINLMRLKTGTPPRLEKESIDYTKIIPQPGTEEKQGFSYTTKEFLPIDQQIICHLTYTNEKTHEIIRNHLSDSAMYGGLVEGVGPRYCPSIEDKIVRFADKERHQIFLEPESLFTNSIYAQGISTSMPEEVQEQIVHSIRGLEKAVILKYAYAIEYDSCNPLDLKPTLEMKKWPGLYIAGQICGTSGYEEAAALGLMAGINAVRKIHGKSPFILRRDQAYIGVMIDDIVTKGIEDPYRLLSSRAEYRLLLRHDNADLRLLDLGYEVGLIDQARYDEFLIKKANMAKAEQILSTTFLPSNADVVFYLESVGYPNFIGGLTAYDLLKRPRVGYYKLRPFIEELHNLELDDNAVFQLEVAIKYAGYIERQNISARKLQKLEKVAIPPGVDYANLEGIALEARQKLAQVQPLTLGQASRISGVNPSDIAILSMYMKRGWK
ncbi:MAG: tRNA uridine-5-carboxymethylaminomethyl(34) synthesis enzyme MnmG [Bacilli bacterium]